MVGTTLGVYRIDEEIGRGGMGQVYRAHDTALNRDVAIKVLPDGLGSDPDRLMRFEREAQALAALNHPHIAHVYGLEKSGDTPAIVMELVEGPTLADRIAKGPIPLDEALPIARQIAEALEAAHERGIIHRDLKPANIKLKDDGTVKLLDFGLAKALDPSMTPGTSEAANSPTLTNRATQFGIILGTAAYMAPEQARGKVVDKRADIWAFGVVLYEMLTGRRAFDASETSDILAYILTKEPDWEGLPSGTPPVIRRLLAHCLTKDPKQRLHDIADARLEFEEVLGASSGGMTTATMLDRDPAAISRRRMLTLAVTMLVIGVIAGGFAWSQLMKAGYVPLQVVRFSHRVANFGTVSLAVSPDGRHLAYVAGEADGKSRLWIRPLDQEEAFPVAGTEGASFPFWNPESDSLGYFADGKLKILTVEDGTSRALCDAPNARGGAWGAHGVIVFAPTGESPLLQVSADAIKASPVAITTLDTGGGETSHRFPMFHPDGVNFVFFAMKGNEDLGRIYATAVGRETAQLLLDTDAAALTGSGVVYSRDGVLRVRSWSPGQTELGQERVIASGVSIDERAGSMVDMLRTGQPPFSVSQGGTLAYVGLVAPSESRLVWFRATGEPIGVVGESQAYQAVALAPSARHVALTSASGLQIRDATTGILLRPPFEGRFHEPDWMPDGLQLVYLTDNDWVVYRHPLGGGQAELMFDDARNIVRSPSVSPRGSFLTLSQWNGSTDFDIVAFALDRDGRASGNAAPIVTRPGAQRNGRVSPNERWIAFVSSTATLPELLVQPFPGSQPAMRVSSDDASDPRWRPASNELYYVEANHRLMRVDIPEASVTGPSPARLAFDIRRTFPGTTIRGYAVASDGRVLINVADPPPPTEIKVILNWPAIGGR